MSVGTYTIGAELPDWAHAFKDRNAVIIDMSSGWTFEVKIGTAGSTALLTKTTNITGWDGTAGYSVLVSWQTTAELSTLAAGTYQIQLRATRSSDGKDRIYKDTIQIDSAIT
jgi:hypothetical protein